MCLYKTYFEEMILIDLVFEGNKSPGLPAVGRPAAPGRSAARSRWGFSTVAGTSAPPQGSPERCSRAG